MMSPSILAGTSTRENVSKEWMKAAGTVGAIAAVVAGAAALPIAGVPLAGAIIGGWLGKAVKATSRKKGDK